MSVWQRTAVEKGPRGAVGKYQTTHSSPHWQGSWHSQPQPGTSAVGQWPVSGMSSAQHASWLKIIHVLFTDCQWLVSEMSSAQHTSWLEKNMSSLLSVAGLWNVICTTHITIGKTHVLFTDCQWLVSEISSAQHTSWLEKLMSSLLTVSGWTLESHHLHNTCH